MLEIWQVFVDPNNTFFSVCLMVCAMIFLLEILGLIMGFTNDWMDNLIPDSLKLDLDLDGSQGALVTLSSWVYLGRMPLLIWLIIFFGGWGTTGLVLQSIIENIVGHSLIALLAIPIAFVINLFVVHISCRIINPILPKDETTAIELKELIGLKAKIVVGTAKLNYPAQAKVVDKHGTTHYIMVTPQVDTEYNQNHDLIISEKTGNDFVVIESNQELFINNQ